MQHKSVFLTIQYEDEEKENEGRFVIMITFTAAELKDGTQNYLLMTL